MRRSLLTSARLMDQEARDGGFRPKVAMLTVTYRPDEDWQARQLTACLDSIRKWLRRRGHPLRYAWGLELTKAGRPHYHVLVWLPKGLTLPKPDKQGWWPHGFTRIEWARYALGYIAKYASKGLTIEEASQLPKGARLHGCAGLSDSSRLERRWWLAPKWVREQCDPEDDPRPAPGGGWLLRATGLHLPSPWRLAGHCPGWTWLAFQPAQGEL